MVLEFVSRRPWRIVVRSCARKKGRGRKLWMVQLRKGVVEGVKMVRRKKRMAVVREMAKRPWAVEAG